MLHGYLTVRTAACSSPGAQQGLHKTRDGEACRGSLLSVLAVIGGASPASAGMSAGGACASAGASACDRGAFRALPSSGQAGAGIGAPRAAATPGLCISIRADCAVTPA